MSTIHTIGGEWVQAITVEDRQVAIDAAAIALRDYQTMSTNDWYTWNELDAAEAAIDAAFKKVFRNA